MTFTIKKGNLDPSLTVRLLANGTAINLAGATVTFIMRLPEATSPKIHADATVNLDGSVTYTWTGSDTDTVGKYKAEWKIVPLSGKPRTVPNDGYDYIEIIDNLE